MPWDATRLRVGRVRRRTARSARRRSPPAARTSRSPSRTGRPTATLHLVSDRSGWWNLYRLVDGPRLEPLAPMEAEFADPAWVFDRSSYGFLPDGSIVAVARARRPRPALPHRAGHARSARSRSPFTELDALRVGGPRRRRHRRPPGRPGGRRPVRPGDPGPGRRPAPGEHASRSTRRSSPSPSRSSSRRPAAGPPTRSSTRRPTPTSPAPDGERPPLLVLSHGGPTSNASTALDLGKQLLTSRGIAVVDVDYGGSTGYGREYRRRLDGQWGVVDVDDCVAAARFLVERGDVDPERLAIEGGSAGGYTTLAALAFRDVFAAGISLFGIGDLETLEHRHRTSSSRATPTGWSGRIRRRPRSTASARRSTTSTGSRARCSSSRASRTRSCRQPGRGDRRGPRRQRHPARLPRVRGRGPRLPRRGRASGGRSRPSSRSSARSSASSRPTSSSRSSCPASTPGAPDARPSRPAVRAPSSRTAASRRPTSSA